MGEIWAVLVEDRHADVGAYPFSTEELAVAFARDQAGEDEREEDDRDPEEDPETGLTPLMRELGWVLCLPYGTEGDVVRVVRRTVDAGA